MRSENTERPLRASNHYADPADHAVLDEECRRTEAGLGCEILNHHRVIEQQGEAGLRATIVRHSRPSDVPRLPADAGPKEQLGSLGGKLEDFAEVRAESFRDDRAGVVHQPRQVLLTKGALPQVCHHALLVQTDFERLTLCRQ